MGKEQWVERWALARLYSEGGLVRVEACRATEQGVEQLVAMADPDSQKPKPEVENLDWWEQESESRRTTAQELLEELGLGADTDLAEGMVFYVFKGDGNKLDKVLNATPLARALSKAMYNTLLNIPSDNVGGAR